MHPRTSPNTRGHPGGDPTRRVRHLRRCRKHGDDAAAITWCRGSCLDARALGTPAGAPWPAAGPAVQGTPPLLGGGLRAGRALLGVPEERLTAARGRTRRTRLPGWPRLMNRRVPGTSTEDSRIRCPLKSRKHGDEGDDAALRGATGLT
ncbi:hypothetical protein NDU88_006016 [Pleurodeles waltl]|uniref:Uncharacterized protein n=1 Tax=Pleurodeles waltl TaxID=8319 RepID=A0AAV7VQ56_PLEWA|nr:hypothetical protein NDU88_006016 [Pleurodeles waltl]